MNDNYMSFKSTLPEVIDTERLLDILKEQRDTIDKLSEILLPAIEAAKQRKSEHSDFGHLGVSFVVMDNALIEAGEVLGL